MVAADLAWLYPLDGVQEAQFRQQGFIRLPGVVSSATASLLAKRLSQLVSFGGRRRRDGSYGRAFRYCMHAWTSDEKIREVTLSRRLAAIAARLLGVSEIRLSHDQAMFKDAGAEATPIHADQYHIPLSSDVVTAWVALQPIALDMGPLSFYAGSHRLEPSLRKKLAAMDQDGVENFFAQFEEDVAAYSPGDVSYHLGWTYHRAGANSSSAVRAAFGIVYAPNGVVIIEPSDGQNVALLSHWSPGARIGHPLSSSRNPIVFRA